MKRTLTIALLCLFLLNVVGYYGIFLGFQLKYEEQARQHLDAKQYDDADVVTFKIPLSIPYFSDNEDFQRVEGDFEHNGEVYRLLKQKYSQDTLTVVCVRDHESGKINRAMADYVKTFTDKPVNGKHQDSKSIQNFCKDYMTTLVSVEAHTSGWKSALVFGDYQERNFSFDPARIKYPPKQSLLM